MKKVYLKIKYNKKATEAMAQSNAHEM